MRRSLVVSLALAGGLAVAVLPAPAAAPAFPDGGVIVRDCYGHEELDDASVRSTVGASRGGHGGGGAAKKSAPASAPAPMAPPAGRSYGPVADKAMDEAAAAPEKEARNHADAPAGGQAGVAAAEAAKAKAASDGDREAQGRRQPAPADEAPPTRPGEPSLEWGGTVYLSNDDSMSLASAQRLLFAVMNGVGFSVDQIRPHELLNYFSFDTVAPDADQTFDVLASAEQDGDRLAVALAVKGASPAPLPLDLTLVVDRSGSMSAEGRMDYTRRGMHLMADQLQRGDRLDVVLFDDEVCTPLQNFVVGRDDPKLLDRVIDGLQPRGSTDVDLGLREAYRVAKAHESTHGRNRRMMLVTDALMNTGDVNPDTVSEIGRAFEADGIRLTGVGVGREFNDEVLDLLTEKGKGAYVFLGSEAVVDRLLGPAGFDSLVRTVAHDVHFSIELPPSLAMERFYGEEASTVKEEVQPINYYAGTSQVFLQDLAVRNGRVVPGDEVRFVVEYRDAVTGEPETRTFATTVGKMLATDPHNVRKARALMAWSDVLTAQAMGADPCGDPLRTYARRAGRVADDAEIAFVNGLVRNTCGEFDLPTVVSDAGVPFKVKVDADIPISSVALDCQGDRHVEAIGGSDVIAMFTAPAGAVCEVTLAGTVDMRAEVEVPVTGGDLRCLVRGGRLHCS